MGEDSKRTLSKDSAGTGDLISGSNDDEERTFLSPLKNWASSISKRISARISSATKSKIKKTNTQTEAQRAKANTQREKQRVSQANDDLKILYGLNGLSAQAAMKQPSYKQYKKAMDEQSLLWVNNRLKENDVWKLLNLDTYQKSKAGNTIEWFVWRDFQKLQVTVAVKNLEAMAKAHAKAKPLGY